MTNENHATKYISLRKGGIYAGCSERFLRRRMAGGDLESFLVGGRRFTTREAIDAMMYRNRNRRPRMGRGVRNGAPS